MMMKTFLCLALFATISFLSAAEINLAQGKKVMSSSCERANMLPGLAVDGNLKTRWASQFNDPQWFTVDLGTPVKIGRIVIHWERAYAKEFKIQVSTDGKHWKEILFRDNAKGGEETLKFTPETARYVRFAGEQRATGAGYSFWEFQIFEK